MLRAAAFIAGLIGLTGLLAQVRADDGHVGPDTEDSKGDIFGTGWGMTLGLDGTGFYNDVLKAVLGAMDTPKLYQPLPYKRAKVDFANHLDSCLYPSDIGHLVTGKEIESADGYIQTAPLVWVESHIFSRYGEPPLPSFENLRGRKVAYPNGSALPTVLEAYGPSFLPTTTETAKARMLIAGRVDHMSGSLPDNIFVFREMERPLPPYNPDLALIRVGVSVVCHDTPKNRSFIEAFNAAAAARNQSGETEALFSKSGVDKRFIPSGE